MKCFAMSVASAIIAFSLISPTAQAAFQTFVDFEQWQAAAGEITTIDFTGFPYGTIITDQYSELGVTFPDGNDLVLGSPYPLDHFGLKDLGDEKITILFDVPQRWIGIHHPGDVQIEYYFGDQFLFMDAFTGGGGASFFHGVLSDQYFDKAIVLDPLEKTIDIDNLYFGPVPTPGVLSLLAGLLALRHRSRC